MASSLVEYDTIDKYVDYDLYTQTVDPNRQAPWIYEGDLISFTSFQKKVFRQAKTVIF
jgi:hypothetical protein